MIFFVLCLDCWKYFLQVTCLNHVTGGSFFEPQDKVPAPNQSCTAEYHDSIPTCGQSNSSLSTNL